MRAEFPKFWTTLRSAACLVILAFGASAVEMPPRKSFLADSVYPLGHGHPGQQDALTVRGPTDPGPVLDPSQIQYAPTGPAQFGA